MPPIRSPIPAVPKQDAPPVPFGLGELGPLNTGGDMTRPERFRADQVIQATRRHGDERRAYEEERARHRAVVDRYDLARYSLKNLHARQLGADFEPGELGPTGTGGYHPDASRRFPRPLSSLRYDQMQRDLNWNLLAGGSAMQQGYAQRERNALEQGVDFGVGELGSLDTGGPAHPDAMMQRYRQMEQEGRLFNPATGQPTIPLQPEYYQQRGAETLARGAAGLVPVVGTAVNWNQMGPGERAFSMGLDAVDIATLGAGKALTAPARWGGRAIRNIFGRSDAVAPSLASGPAAPSPRYFPRQSRTYPVGPGGTNYSPIDALRPMKPPWGPPGQGGSTRLLRDPVRAAEYSKPTIGDGLTDFGWSLPYTTVGRGVNQLFDPYASLGDNRAPGEGLFNPISPSI
jgi:hypothetical protein